MANEVFFAQNDDPQMILAYKKAQDTFKYFWRELYWERRRIVPALDVAYVKVAFAQDTKNDDSPIIEHMWIEDINFDGNKVTGTLINKPNRLTNVAQGNNVEIPLNQISDWLFAINRKTYGGFTIQVLRSEMTARAREEHDNAWGLNFGDYDEVLLVFEQKRNPENLIEHPMSINMQPKFIEFLESNPHSVFEKDDMGYTMLHKEAIAGNASAIEVLTRFTLDISEKTNSGKTALDFAKDLDWTHIIPLLEK